MPISASNTIGRDGIGPVVDLNVGTQAVGSLAADDLEFAGVALEGYFYYAARTLSSGRELWRTDGTLEGTERLTDFCGGPCDANPRDLTVFAGWLYLTIDDASGTRLMRFDPRRDHLRTVAGSPFEPLVATAERGFRLRVWNDSLYFLGGVGGQAGLYEVNSGGRARRVTPLVAAPRDPLYAAADHLFFFAPRTARGPLWLWASNGSEIGSEPLVQLCGNALCSVAPESIVLGNRLLLPIRRANTGFELWASGGTPNTTELLYDLCPGPCQGVGDTPFLDVLDSEVFFVGQGADDSDQRLWATDGSTPPRALISDATIGNVTPLLGYPRPAARLGQRLLFGGYTPDHGAELFSTDGSTIQLEVDTVPGPASGQPVLLTPSGDSVYFRTLANEGLWVLDDDGARAVAIEPRLLGGLASDDSGAVYFPGFDEVRGAELWTSDGNGGQLIRDTPQDPAGSAPRHFQVFGDEVVFVARQSDGRDRLWRSDGTAEGTRLLTAEGPGESAELFVYKEAPGGPAVLWSRGTTADLPGLWISDGTEAGTEALRPTLDAARHFRMLGNGRVLFAAAELVDPNSNGAESLAGQELWSTNGTPSGTFQLANLAADNLPFPGVPGPLSSEPRDIIPFAFGAAFSAAGTTDLIDGQSPDEAFLGREPYFTDGSPEGTQLLTDLCPGPCSSDPQEFIVLGPEFEFPGVPIGQTLLFTAMSDDGVRRLWALDGAPPSATPRPVFGFAPGFAYANPRGLRVVGSEIFFVATTLDRSSDAIFATDGNETRLVSGIGLGGSTLRVTDGRFSAAGGRYFFVAGIRNSSPLPFGNELWVSDGTEAGTRQLRAIQPRQGDARPQRLTSLRGDLYGEQLGERVLFVADDGLTGLEPWISDGTDAGTHRLGDLVDGPLSGNPTEFTLATGGRLFFAADAPELGREPWLALLDRGPRTCDATRGLCMEHERFEVRVRWRDFRNDRGGNATPAPLDASDRAGFFHFFRPGNLEMAVKVLDASTINASAWFFAASLTDLEHWIEIENLSTREVRNYYNPPRGTCGVADDRSLPLPFDPVAAPSTQGERAGRWVSYSAVDAAASGTCVATANTLCLGEGRFAISVFYEEGDDRLQPAQAETLGDSGWFWFFQRNNPEIIIKLLDARSIDGKFWLYFAPLTTLPGRVEILDTVTSNQYLYSTGSRGDERPCTSLTVLPDL